jgi:hypothetical protein
VLNEFVKAIAAGQAPPWELSPGEREAWDRMKAESDAHPQRTFWPEWDG